MSARSNATIPLRQAHAPLVLALDFGTSSLRALVFDARGRFVEGALARRPNGFRFDAEGAAEADAEALCAKLEACIDAALAKLGARRHDVRAVVACSFVGNILGLDVNGRVCTPVLTYADTRAGAEVQALRARFDEREIWQRTGCPFHTSYLPAQLNWVRKRRAAWFKAARTWVSAGEYFQRRLFARTWASPSVASWTGLLNRRADMWDAALLKQLGLRAEQFSPLAWRDAQGRLPVLRGLTGRYAQRWSALREIPWLPVLADGAAANLGSGCTDAARVAVTIGTTGAVRVVVPAPVKRVPRGLWCYRIDETRELVGGALNEGGNVAEWLRATLKLPSEAQLEAYLLRRVPGSGGLAMLPFFNGERAPGWVSSARGVLSGLNFSQRPEELYATGLEAVCLRLAAIAARLEPLLPARAAFVASGGALLASAGWRRMLVNALGRPLFPLHVSEASARGAALQALCELGVMKSEAHAPLCLGPQLRANKSAHQASQTAGRAQELLYEKMVAWTGAKR